MNNNGDWLEDKISQSEFWQKRLKAYQNANSYDKKDIEKTLKLKPDDMYKNFIRFPSVLFRILVKNWNQFAVTEYILLQAIMDECFSWSRLIIKYKPVEIQKQCNLNKRTFFRSLEKIQEKDIINVTTLTNSELKREKKKKNGYRILTKKKIELNPFWDTWKVDLDTEGIQLDQADKNMQEEIEKILCELNEM